MTVTPEAPVREATLKLYETYRGYIIHEDDLINSRTTWLITIQSVLFGIFGFTCQKYLEVTANLINNARNLDFSKPEAAKNYLLAISRDKENILGGAFQLVSFIIAGTPFLGIIVSVACVCSIKAAWDAMQSVKMAGDSHTDLFQQHKLPGLTGGGDKDAPWRGLAIGLALPISIGIFWSFSFFWIFAFLQTPLRFGSF